MTTLTRVDYHPGETRSQAVARRLRGELAQLNISASEAARRAGFTQAFLSRRLTGRVPFHVDDLETICTTLGLSFEYITSGIRGVEDHPPSPPKPPSSAPQPRKAPRRRLRSVGTTDLAGVDADAAYMVLLSEQQGLASKDDSPPDQSLPDSPVFTDKDINCLPDGHSSAQAALPNAA